MGSFKELTSSTSTSAPAASASIGTRAVIVPGATKVMVAPAACTAACVAEPVSSARISTSTPWRSVIRLPGPSGATDSSSAWAASSRPWIWGSSRASSVGDSRASAFGRSGRVGGAGWAPATAGNVTPTTTATATIAATFELRHALMCRPPRSTTGARTLPNRSGGRCSPWRHGDRRPAGPATVGQGMVL